MSSQPFGQMVGFLPVGLTSFATQATILNDASDRVALSFTLPVDETVNKVRIFLQGITGTFIFGDLAMDLFDTATTGLPGSSLATSSTLTAIPTGAGWIEFTGYTLAALAGVQYFAVLRNGAASATATQRSGTLKSGPVAIQGQTSNYTWKRLVSTDAGATWPTLQTGTVGLRVECASGRFYGAAISNVANAVAARYVYSTREAGVRITTPANGRMNVTGLGMWIGKTGSPAADARLRLYLGTTLQRTSHTLPRGHVGTIPNLFNATWASPVILEPATVYRLVIGEDTNSDTSANAFLTGEYTIENDVNSKAMLPLGVQRTYFDGTSWVDDDTSFSPFGLILDPAGEFAAQAGGGAAVSHLIE